MKIWVDDIRTPPDDTWTWFKTSTSVMEMLCNWRNNWYSISEVIDVMSLDHDLGGEDTTRGIVLAFCEWNDWPVEVRVHSQNPIGREWLEGMIARYKP